MSVSKFLRDLLVPAAIEAAMYEPEPMRRQAIDYVVARHAISRDDDAYDALCAVAGEQVRRLETTADVHGFLAGLPCATEAA